MLEVKNLTKIYKQGESEIVALSDISFNLSEGEMLAVVGPSGSGKSTLLSIVAGLASPTSGSLRLAGTDLDFSNRKRLAKMRRKQIGFVFQDYHLIPYLTALENLLVVPHISRSLNRDTRKKAKRLLEEFGLDNRMDHLPASLSGGERQRVAVARALMNDPALLLADEPTANLDTERGLKVIDLLKVQSKRDGRACIIVTHDMRMCGDFDATVRLVDGKASPMA